ncbi:DUF6538 domain-containing protein [Falsiroseomonas sp. E2-1-a4]|uniref:DUF6538 domain-containing protein n=1 Tax=Falsiroseomonas sp. E2-1-a4 TaxID=3239299 RepID=UPI003F2A771B
MGIHSASYSLVRNGRHFIRVRVPIDLVPRLERVEIVRALGTDDRRAARAVTSGVAFRLRDFWAMIRRQSAPTAVQLRKIADFWLQRAIREQWAILERGDFATEVAPAELRDGQLRAFSAEMFSRDARELADAALDEVAQNNFRRFDSEAGRLLEATGFGARTGERDRAILARLLLEQFIDLQQTKMDWARGDFAAVPPQMAEPTPATPDIDAAATGTVLAANSTSVSKSRTLATAIDLFTDRMRQHGSTSKQISEARAKLRILTDALGFDRRVAEVTRADAGQIREALQSLPPGFRKHEALAGLGLFEMADTARRLSLKPLSFRTVNSCVVTMRNLFEHERFSGQVEHNPFDGLRVAKPRNFKKQDRTLSSPELESLFGSPLFQGAKSAARRYDPGIHLIGTWVFWAPLIALLTGARIGEIAQLRPCDVRFINGVPVLDINDEGRKSLKNPGTARIIPLHRRLVELGLVKLAEERRAMGAYLLLPEIPKAVGGDPGKAPGQWMSERFLPRLGLKNRVGLGFHSLRHTLKTLLRDARVPDSVSNEICGHDKRSVGNDYGVVSLKAMQDALERIELPAAVKALKPRY